MLSGRRVVLAVTGGVAAYKAAYLARRLQEAGASVRAVMTESSQAFLGAQTLAAITGRPVIDRFFGGESVSPHTELAAWADVIVVAPATTATIARLASGLSEDVVSATCVAARCPVVVAPAMHTEMWEHPATQRNVARLTQDGVVVVGPATGDLAGGDVGPGRMVEPEAIVAAIRRTMEGPMTDVDVLVTAGGTREPVDAVRFIGNRSSGKMGHAIADAACRRGARVTLVTTSDIPSDTGVAVIRVESAEQMNAAVEQATPDIAVMAAAVADFRPKAPSSGKFSRSDGPPEIRLEPTPDILAGVVGREQRPRLVVGFAAEAGSLDRAIAKARTKGVDLLVANDITAEGAGFGTDTNVVSLITPDGAVEAWPIASKRDVAERLIERCARLLRERSDSE